jgi:hypothetical protein
VDAGEVVRTAQARENTAIDLVAWNPKKPILAFAMEDKENRDSYNGVIGLFVPPAPFSFNK